MESVRKNKMIIAGGVATYILLTGVSLSLFGETTTKVESVTHKQDKKVTSSVTAVTELASELDSYADATTPVDSSSISKFETIHNDIQSIDEEPAVTPIGSVDSSSLTEKSKKKKKNDKKAEDSDTSDKNEEIPEYYWDGPVLTSFAGIVAGPSGNETYYNLDMSGVISIMQNAGYNYNYWVRDDGVKMYGDYVMVAADLSIRPRGTIIPTSLGLGIVCDTGGFVGWDNTRLDIAVTW